MVVPKVSADIVKLILNEILVVPKVSADIVKLILNEIMVAEKSAWMRPCIATFVCHRFI